MRSPVPALVLGLLLAGAHAASAETACVQVPAPASASFPLCSAIVPIGVVSPPGGFHTGCGARVVLIDHFAADGPVLLEFPPGPACGNQALGGARRFECLLEQGATGSGIGSLMTFVGGVRAGAIRDAFAARFAGDTDAREHLCWAEYRGNGRRVIVAPIVEPIAQSGRRWVHVLGFAAFFIPSRPLDDMLEGEFLYPVAIGTP